MIKFSVSATVIPGCLSFLELLKICDMLSPGRRGMGFAHRKIGKEMVSVFPLLQPCHWLNCRGTREVRWNISMSSHTYVHVAAPVNVWSHLIQPDQWQHNWDIDHGTRTYVPYFFQTMSLGDYLQTSLPVYLGTTVSFLLQ